MRGEEEEHIVSAESMVYNTVVPPTPGDGEGEGGENVHIKTHGSTSGDSG